MKIKALISFSGVISMRKGEIIDYEEESVIADLLNAGFIKIEEGKEIKVPQKAETSKEVVKDDNKRADKGSNSRLS